ncbi:MAG: DMT family transporter, partial [Patescibacteria group bacterium]
AFLAIPFGAAIPDGIDLWVAILSGMTFGAAMWAMFAAVKASEASHIDPFIGAVITIATYIFSTIFLGEHLTELQFVGVFVLAAASFLLSFEKSKNHNGFHSGFLWGMLAGVLFAISHVCAKYVYDNYPFLTAIVWARGSGGLFGLALLFVPSVWRSVMRRRTNGDEPKTYGKRHVIIIVAANKILSVVAIVLANYAIAIGSVTLVNALAGAQYVFMFFMIYFLTKFFPKIFQEYFTKREFFVETIAIALIVVGSVLFVV